MSNYLSKDKQIVIITRLKMGCDAGEKPLPKYLANFFSEMAKDTGLPLPRNGDLSPWKDGPIALLSFEELNGYQLYEAVSSRSAMDTPCVFILMGAQAQDLKGAVSTKNSHVISVRSCSGYQAGKGFFGSRIFTKACSLLGISVDCWRLG